MRHFCLVVCMDRAVRRVCVEVLWGDIVVAERDGRGIYAESTFVRRSQKFKEALLEHGPTSSPLSCGAPRPRSNPKLRRPPSVVTASEVMSMAPM